MKKSIFKVAFVALIAGITISSCMSPEDKLEKSE